MDFPSDSILLARGKYSTINSERRTRMTELHRRITRITDQARVLLRFDENAGESIALYQAMVVEVKATGECLGVLTKLQEQLDELKPEAWGKTEVSE